MTHIDWSPELQTGDATVDAQHEQLFDMLGTFSKLGDDVHSGLVMADSIMSHVEVHFETEEDLMRRYAYPSRQFADHARVHAELKDRARQLVLGFRAGWETSKDSFVEFLEQWLIGHTRTYDAELVRFLKQARGGNNAAS